jgi:Rieske Fe-S protein
MPRFLHIALISGALILLTSILPSCETNRGQIIPYVKVDVDLDMYAELGNMGIGTTLILPSEGHQGIVLYREDDLLFHAYDLTCTEYPEHDAAVVEDKDFIGVFKCPECGSRYILINGAYPDSGPAEYPLVEYRTSIQGNLLIITN